jgi:GH24 family phage-related lysozyme (muramidase)
MISLRKILKEAMDAQPQMPPAIIQHADVVSADYIDFLKRIENEHKVGYKNGKWYPHRSAEGGMPTIAWGHKIGTAHELNRMNGGISNSEAEALLKKDINTAMEKVNSYIKTLHVNIPLSQPQREMLIDMAFNVGDLGKFPKFTKAVLNRDWKTAERECTRYYGDGKPLKKRNDEFKKRYFGK